MQATIVVLMLVLVLAQHLRIFSGLVFWPERLEPWRVLQNIPCVQLRTLSED
jgi:hypothetical protein